MDELSRQVAALVRENARLSGELSQRTDDLRQSRENQAAISEVLAAISRSTVDLAPVLQTLADTALRLCEAEMGFIVRRDGEAFFVVTATGSTPEITRDAEDYKRHQATVPIAVDRGSVTGRVALAGEPVQIPDIAADPEYRLAGATQLGKIRTQVGVPLVREGALAGVLILSRQRVEPFSERQVGLLSTFADQAVIAMENARLLGELRESLDQQTATAEVLKTISRSATDLGEVLDALLATVARLCKADQAYMLRRDGELHHLIAAHGAPAEGEAYIRNHPFRPERGTTSGRAAMEKRVVHIPDVVADPEYDYVEGQRSAGFRTMLGLPLLREDTLLGVFVLARTTVDPFSPREIELASGFADQAVIAIENARLFEELGDRQAELRVTLDNTGDGVVMFDADLRLASWNRNFQAMLDIPDAFVAGRPGFDDYLRLLIGRGELGDGDPESIVAGYRERVARQWSAERTRPDGRIIEVRNNPVPDGGAVLIYSDITERKNAEGKIAAARDAAEEALEQQTATAEILRAISESPIDVRPVLDAVVKAAVRFCGATDAVIVLREGDGAAFAAHEGPTVVVVGSSLPLNRETAPGRAILDGQTCHLPDIAALDPVEFATVKQIAAEHGFRASLAAPLLRKNTAIGSVTLRKAEVGPFTPRQIELLETFAAQAVIAIENVRLFNDLRESLERQTATADILKVIASSPADMKPAFDAIAESAKRLLGGLSTTVWRLEGEGYHLEAFTPTSEEADRALRAMSPISRAQGDTLSPAAAGLSVREVPDTETGPPFMRDIARLRGFRASLAVSLAIEGQPIGFVNVTRREPGAFRPEDVELLKTFADQAVIAIQNARLFTELSDALEQQTATAEILRVISQSPTDVSPVLAAVAKAALKFCGAGDALVSLRDADNWFIAAHEGPIEATPGLRRLTRGTAPGRAMVDGTVAHVADLQSPEADDYPEAREFGAREGFRAALAAPLLRDDVPIGAISLRRPEPGPFTPNQVDLLKSFAAQAVIAIENVRLFTELRESLDQQTAMADILRVISQSPTDVQPVFAAVAESSVRLCGADRAFIFRFDGELLRMVASHNCDPEFVKWVAQHPIPPGRHSGSGRAALERRTIHVPDVLADPEYSYGAKDVEAIRTILGVPILKGEDLLGVMMIFHLEVRPFTDKQIALVETFADQAAIAIENVRLFTELRDSLERLKAAQANLVHSEKMASLGQLTAGIAHEIKNPLNFVNNFASLSVELLDELKETADAAFATLDADTQAEIDETMELLTANLGKIAEHGKRADGIVRSMLSHSRGGSGDWTPSDINALVEEALNLAYHGARAQDNEFNVTLERDFAPTPAPIEVVPQDVTRVFLNMFGNGFYAVGKRRKVGKQAEPGFRPTLKVTTRDLGEAVEVRVRDNGTGIPPDVREKLFQPFFTTKPTGEGTGLGLSISYDIVTQQHGGTIEVESEPGSFTEFTVRLPRRRVQPSERA